MTDGPRIKPTAHFSHLLRQISAEMRTGSPGEDLRSDQFGGVSHPKQIEGAGDEAWNGVVAMSLQFWDADPAPSSAMRSVVAADLVKALDGLEGVIATGEAAALLEDHRRLHHGFDIIYDGAPPKDVVDFLAELQTLLADWTRDFVSKLKDDLILSKASILKLLDEDARAFAVIILDALSQQRPIDRLVLDGAIQNLRATLSQADYRTEHTAELDVLAKRLDWLHAAVDLRSPVLEAR
jgi:hypothetical protein